MNKAVITLQTAISAGVAAAVAKSDVDARASAVTPIAASVGAQIIPILQNATNNEPWYQSRVTWGVIIAAMATIAKPFIGELPISAEQTADIVNALATAGQGIGFALTLYGRWKAKKPIGA